MPPIISAPASTQGSVQILVKTENNNSRPELSMWTKITRNAFSNIAGTALSLGVGFVLMPLIVHRIGASDFGIWMLVNSVVGYMGLVDFGLAPTLVKKTAEHLAVDGEDARRRLNRTVSTVFGLYVLIGAAVGLAIALLSQLPEGIFKVPAEDFATFKAVLWIVGFQAALSFPMSIWHGLLGGLQDFHYANFVGIVTNILRVIGTLWVLESGNGLLGLIWMGFGITCVSWAARWWWVRRKIPDLKLTLSGFDRAEVKGLAHFSGAMVIWSMAGYAVHQLDKVLIGIFLPVAFITTYEIGARISNYSRNVLHSWLSVVMPAAAALKAQGDSAMLRNLYLTGTKYLLLSYVGVVIALLGFGREFIVLWMGQEFSQAVLIMDILLVGSLFQSQNLVAHVMLPGMSRLRVFTRIMLGYIVCTTVLGILFVTQWGLPGMAAAIATTMVLMESMFITYIFREFDVRFHDFARVCLLPSVVAALPAVAWIFMAHRFLPAATWARLVVDVGVCLSLYGVAFWQFGLSAHERTAVKWRVLVILGRRVQNPEEDPAAAETVRGNLR